MRSPAPVRRVIEELRTSAQAPLQFCTDTPPPNPNPRPRAFHEKTPQSRGAGGDTMKIGKIVLAVLLAAGTVAAYWYFPNPLEDAAETQGAAPKDADEPRPSGPAEAV